MGKYIFRSKKKGKRRWRIKTLIKKYHGKCNFCSCHVTLGHMEDTQASVDHIIPLSKDGSEEFPNLQLLCRKCNQDKGDSILDEDGEIMEEIDAN